MMTNLWLYTLICVGIVSALSLIAVFFLTFSEKTIRKLLLFLVSFAVGGLFGDAFIHLLPETFEKLGFSLTSSLLILAGILIFFILEKFIHWRHCHDIDCAEHTHPVVAVNFIGDAVHNFIDGMLIAASFVVSIPLGFTTTIAVILHEIPHEIGNFGVFVHGGLAAKKALLYNFLSALTAILGAVITLIIGPQVKGFSEILLPITAGGFIYVAGSDLIPELKHEVHLSHSFLQLTAILFGIILMAALTFFEF